MPAAHVIRWSVRIPQFSHFLAAVLDGLLLRSTFLSLWAPFCSSGFYTNCVFCLVCSASLHTTSFCHFYALNQQFEFASSKVFSTFPPYMLLFSGRSLGGWVGNCGPVKPFGYANKPDLSLFFYTLCHNQHKHFSSLPVLGLPDPAIKGLCKLFCLTLHRYQWVHIFTFSHRIPRPSQRTAPAKCLCVVCVSLRDAASRRELLSVIALLADSQPDILVAGLLYCLLNSGIVCKNGEPRLGLGIFSCCFNSSMCIDGSCPPKWNMRIYAPFCSLCTLLRCHTYLQL